MKRIGTAFLVFLAFMLVAILFPELFLFLFSPKPIPLSAEEALLNALKYGQQMASAKDGAQNFPGVHEVSFVPSIPDIDENLRHLMNEHEKIRWYDSYDAKVHAVDKLIMPGFLAGGYYRAEAVEIGLKPGFSLISHVVTHDKTKLKFVVRQQRKFTHVQMLNKDWMNVSVRGVPGLIFAHTTDDRLVVRLRFETRYNNYEIVARDSVGGQYMMPVLAKLGEQLVSLDVEREK